MTKPYKRNAAKKEIEQEILSVDNNEDDRYYELEMQMSNLCYTVSKLDSNHKCTCPDPSDEQKALDHIAYLNSEIIKKLRRE